MVTIEESQRAHTSPPRKKRKLSNGFTQIPPSPSTNDPSSYSSDQEEKSSLSDKENNHNRNASPRNKKNPRKRPYSALSQPSNSNNKRGRIRNGNGNTNTGVHQFGNTTLKERIEVSPGAIVRLELINFLCHSNFTITFHPFVNVICGQNGS